MKKNVGRADRAGRFILGVLILSAGAWTGSYWGLLGLVPLFTGAISFCPLYSLVGLSTCPMKPRDPDVMT
jgi:hypothetical protein